MCVFYCFCIVFQFGVFLLKFVGSFFSMVTCKSFGSFLLVFVGSLIG